jgi:hypothetical protein
MANEKTVALDEAVPIPNGKVRVIVELVSVPPARSYQEVMADIRERQRARGHKPRTREEVDAALREERDNWDD